MKTTEANTTTEAAVVAEQGAHVAPEKPSSKMDASGEKGAPKGQKAAKVAKTKAVAKKDIVLNLLRRPNGATLTEIAQATAWQNHSIRGFISGTLTKKMGLTVESTKSDAKERVYRIAQ